jgi:hypothetical protein
LTTPGAAATVAATVEVAVVTVFAAVPTTVAAAAVAVSTTVGVLLGGGEGGGGVLPVSGTDADPLDEVGDPDPLDEVGRALGSVCSGADEPCSDAIVVAVPIGLAVVDASTLPPGTVPPPALRGC